MICLTMNTKVWLLFVKLAEEIEHYGAVLCSGHFQGVTNTECTLFSQEDLRIIRLILMKHIVYCDGRNTYGSCLIQMRKTKQIRMKVQCFFFVVVFLKCYALKKRDLFVRIAQFTFITLVRKDREVLWYLEWVNSIFGSLPGWLCLLIW